MTLKELKQMVAEEYTAYKKALKEQGPAGMANDLPNIPDPTVAVSDDDIGGKDTPADILKDIYDKLKNHFEGEDDAKDDAGDDAKDDAGDDAGDDVEGGEDEEADLEEKSSGGAYTKKINESIRKKRLAKNRSKILAESKMKSRFKTLANIKK